MPDTIKITVLEDGTIKTETDKVSMPNHANAEAFLRDIGRLAGGPVTRKAKHGFVLSHTHTHQDGHAHNHA
jgi:hypothetical protein